MKFLKNQEDKAGISGFIKTLDHKKQVYYIFYCSKGEKSGIINKKSTEHKFRKYYVDKYGGKYEFI